MPSIKQGAFSGGEIAPELIGRSDQARYQVGLKTCRNFIVKRAGGVTNRPGTNYLGTVKDSTAQTRLLKFVFNAEQTYVLEFGNLYMRVYKEGERLQVDYDANPAAWSALTAYVVGDMVKVAPFSYYYCIADNTNQTPPNATYWYALPVVAETGDGIKAPYEIPTPYETADLPDLQYVQSGDVVTIVHPNHAPRELARSAHATWTLTAIAFSPSVGVPTGITATGSAGTETHTYAVTAVTDTGEESVSGTSVIAAGTSAPITAITLVLGQEVLVTCGAGHSFVNGQEVRVTGIVGSTQLNNRNFIVTYVSGTQFRLRGMYYRRLGNFGGVGIPNVLPYVSGGTVTAADASTSATTSPPATATPITVAWTAVDGAIEYNVYHKKNGVFGFVGTTRDVTFIDDGIAPDLTITAPVDKAPFTTEGEYPSTLAYFQQRMLFANTEEQPETVYVSQVGSHHNLTSRSPALDDDAFNFTIAARQVQRIRHLVDIGRLVVLTESGEWTMQGDADGVLRPNAVNLHQRGFSGSNTLLPIVVGQSALFVQARGNIVRDMRYELSSDGYPSRDLSIFSSHLFEGYTLTEWDYAPSPLGVVWAVRSDGAMLGLTYLPEHDVVAWHRHDTQDGHLFESVVVVPEGEEDAVYVIVNRDGVRNVERMASRTINDVAADAVFMDCATEFDGTDYWSTQTIVLTGGTLWDSTETLTLTEITPGVGELQPAAGDRIVLTLGDDTVTVQLIDETVTGTWTVRPIGTVPASLRGVAADGYSWARAGISLAAGDWAVLADGNDASVTGHAGGTYTLPTPAVIIRTGYPITYEIETLDHEAVDPAQTIADKRKRIDKVTLLVQNTRGGSVGPDGDHMVELRTYSGALLSTQEPYTGSVEVLLGGHWGTTGRVVVRQTSPLPITILGIIPSLTIGG